MHKSSRNKSDYKVGDICYFVRVEKYPGNPKEGYITLKKVIIKKIPRTLSTDITCDATEDCITNDDLAIYQNWDIPYGWLTKSYDEAIQEIADYQKTTKDIIIRIIFEQ